MRNPPASETSPGFVGQMDSFEETLRSCAEMQATGRVSRLRHPFRWLAAAVILVLLAQVIKGAVVNSHLHWNIVRKYLFSDVILTGLRLTLELTAIAMAIGILGGVVLALMRQSSNPILTAAAAAYLWIMRGTPVIVQLLFWYFLGGVVPRLGLGIPFGPTFVSASANVLIGRMSAAIFGLGLNEAAYMCEIIRGGILSVHHGQMTAAQALGMTKTKAMRRAVLPQALRFIIPPTGNQVIGMLKWTSVVFVLGLPDLLTTAQIIYAENFQQVPLLIVASFWYLLCTTILMVLQSRLERRYTRGVSTRKRARWRLGLRKASP